MDTWLQRLRSPQGSMPMAVLVSIVVGGLALVLLSRTMTSQEQVRFDRDYQLAVNGAEAGVSQAVNVIQQLPAGSTTVSLDSESVGGDTELNGHPFEWTAERQTDGRWQIRSTGWHGQDVRRTLEAEASDDPEFFLAAFGRVGVRMVGNNEVKSFPQQGLGAIGTNRSISIVGNSTADIVMLMGNDAYCEEFDEAANTCNDNPIEGHPEKLDFGEMIADVEAEIAETCEDEFEIFDPDVHLPLQTGTDYCFSRLETGNHEEITVDIAPDDVPEAGAPVTNPARVYVKPGPLTIGNHNRVNCPSGSCSYPDQVPESSALEINTTADALHIGNQSSVAAVIRAPKATCRGNPSAAQVDMYGSLLCNEIGPDGHGNQGGWSFYFDSRLLQLGSGSFDVVSLREEVGDSTSFPD